MIDRFEARATLPGDLHALDGLYAAAFPTEDLRTLVHDLESGRDDVLSLVGKVDGAIIAHVAFSRCRVDGHVVALALLGPLCVAPAWQRKGIGRQLVHDGLKRLQCDGVSRVFVLGDPAYYGRLGFEADKSVRPPYTLPAAWEGAWQSLGLADGDDALRGTLSVPEPWRRKELWLP